MNPCEITAHMQKEKKKKKKKVIRGTENARISTIQTLTIVFDVFLYSKCGVLNCAHGFVLDYNFLIVIKFLSLSPKKKKNGETRYIAHFEHF